jgi:hypothetical protein
MKGLVNNTDNNCYFGIEADDSCSVEGYGIPELLQLKRKQREMIESAKVNEEKRNKELEERKNEK